jgi:hypothetical protein
MCRFPTSAFGYRSCGGIVLIAAAKRACADGSTGRCLVFVLAGSFPRKLSPFQFRDGRMGRGANPPPQFGQTLCSTVSMQVAQNVHS